MDESSLAVKAFIVNEGKLLIVKRKDDDVHSPSIWEIPGGRLDNGEDPKEGLQREVMEETGINIKVLQIINVQHFTRDDGQVITMLLYLCKTDDNEIKLSHEHTEFEWIGLEKVKEKLNKYFHEEVDIYNKLELEKLL